MFGGNPYSENHLLRVTGTLLCVTGIVITNFLLFYWQSALADAYEWGPTFLKAYTGVTLDLLCETFYKLMILGLLACFATLSLGVAVLILVIMSRLRGDPEVSSHSYYDHCKKAVAVVSTCMVLIIVSCVTFVLAFGTSNFGSAMEIRIREGLFVVFLSCACLGLVIFAYMRDRALLDTKFEFERLEWKPVGDIKDEYRKRMKYDMQRLEAAKYGGLQSPYQMANEADEAAARIHGHDKYMLSRGALWG